MISTFCIIPYHPNVTSMGAVAQNFAENETIHVATVAPKMRPNLISESRGWLQWHTICHHLAAESCCDKREPTSKTKSHEILPDFPSRCHIFQKEKNSCSLVTRILNHPQFTNFYVFGHHKCMYPQNS